MALRLIKGGKFEDYSFEVKLKFAQLMVQATYFQKNKEAKELQDLILEYDDEENKEHLLLLEIFSKYEYLLDLGTVPFSYIEQFKNVTEAMLFKDIPDDSPKKNNG